ASLAGRAGVFACLAIGFLTLIEYGSSLDFFIDEILIRRIQRLAGQPPLGRMAVASALCLVVTGLAILFTERKRTAGLGQVLGIASAVIAFLNLIAIIFGSQSDFAAAVHATMALPTAAAITCVDLAVLFARADWGFMRSFLSPGNGGLMARRMLPVAVAGPILLGWLRLQGQITGWYDTRFGLALFTCSNVVCFGFLIWSCAAVLNRLERERSLAQAELKERESRLERVFRDASVGDFCWDIIPDRVSAHPVIWALYGAPNHTGAEPARWFQQRQHPDDLEKINAEVEAAIRGNRKLDTEFRLVQPDG